LFHSFDDVHPAEIVDPEYPLALGHDDAEQNSLDTTLFRKNFQDKLFRQTESRTDRWELA
jgi:hypothetical protein